MQQKDFLSNSPFPIPHSQKARLLRFTSPTDDLSVRNAARFLAFFKTEMHPLTT